MKLLRDIKKDIVIKHNAYRKIIYSNCSTII